ncbi:hypothetical protein [Streptomyces sp. NBC_01483]|uniref:hypothetical protein n=1 Tax=Streptomyces sp. NBC_01483 TaxID=2903883 RepID=UPI002E2EE0CF|nr:hypothetical protein [Streptomyces sp. NBC_01483]
MSSKAERTVVLAANLREFHAWCRANGRSPRDKRLMYAVGPHTLRGVTGARIVRHGDWRDRPDWAELADAAAVIEDHDERELEAVGAIA